METSDWNNGESYCRKGAFVVGSRGEEENGKNMPEGRQVIDVTDTVLVTIEQAGKRDATRAKKVC